MDDLRWDDCVYRIPRDLWDAAVTRQFGPPSPMERLSGIEVRVLDEVDPDTIFVIDVKTMHENVERMLFREPEPIDPIAWKVRLG